MASAKELLAEFKMEAANSRKVLERVPDEKNDWVPHEKSMKLSRLANHIAELTGWGDVIISRDGLDFAKGEYIVNNSENSAERLKFFDEQVARSVAVMEKASDADLENIWSLKNGDAVFFRRPKKWL